MKLANILKVFLVGLVFMAFAGCEKASEQSASTLPEVTFTLELDKTTLEDAQIRVRHSGSADVCWVYMHTTDFETDAAELLSDKLMKDIEFYDEIVVDKGRNKSVQVGDLLPKTEYRFICAAIDPSTGLIYGDAFEFVFKTRRDPAYFEQNDGWSVVREAERHIGEDNMEYDVFSCSSIDDKPYVIVPILKSDYDKYYRSDKRSFFEDYVADFNIPVGDRKWLDVLEVGNAVIYEQRLRSGEWLVFMIGVDDNGELSGYWQCLDMTIERETPTADYLKWEGNWAVADKNGNTLFNIEVKECESNMWYYVAGWERNNIYGYNTADESWQFETYFDKTSKSMVFVSQYIKSVEADERIDFYLTASTLYGDANYIVPHEPERIKLAEAAFYDATGATITGLDFTIGTVSFPLTELFIAGYASKIGTIGTPPALPLIMTKIVE